METKNETNPGSASSKGKIEKEIKKINVLVSGLTGSMGTLLAKSVVKQPDMKLARMAFTGEGMTLKVGNTMEFGGKEVVLIEPKVRKEALEKYISEEGRHPIIADFVAPPIKGQPSPAVGNAEFYCSLNASFVMGSTTSNEDVEKIKKTVVQSGNTAVYAPNMAIPIVIFQDMMQYAANKYPGALKGYLPNLIESHQAAKKDTSGTMKAVIKDLQKLGVGVSEDDIFMVRDPKEQEEDFGISKEFLGGHAYHWYHLTSQDQTAKLSFSHCIDGRDVYVQGALAAIRFLDKKIQEGVRSKIYSMIDVISDAQ